MEQQAKMEENKRQLQAANQQRLQEQQVKMQQMQAQQKELAAKRAQDNQALQQQARARQAEQIAAQGIRKHIMTFRACMPDKFDEAKAALDEAATAEMESCGSQKERVVTEIEQAVMQTKQRHEQMAEMKKKQEEAKIAENARRIGLKEKAQALMDELEPIIEKLETTTKSLVDTAEPLIGDGDLKMAEIEKCAAAVEESGKEANAQAATLSEWLIKESPNIKNLPPVSGDEASTLTADLVKSTARLHEAKKTITLTMSKCLNAKAVRVKKVGAKDKFEKGLTAFKKYAKSGVMSRKEVQAYCKGEHSFTIPAEMLDSICNNLIKEGAKGVDQADFFRMTVMIGISREGALDAKKKVAREALEKEVADKKERLVAKIVKATGVVADATEAVVKAEKHVQPLTTSAKTMTSAEMLAAAKESDDLVETTKESVTAAKDALVALNAEEIEAELKFFFNGEVKKVQNQFNPLEGRVSKAAGLSANFRAIAAKKNSTECEKLRVDSLAMIAHHQGAKKLMSSGVYEEFDKKKSGKVLEAAFVKFFKDCEKKEDTSMSAEDAGRLFNHLDSESVGFIAQEQFMDLIRKFMKVIKASVLTEDISIKSSAVRRIEEGEVVEVLTGPTTEDGADVSRLKVKAMNDDVEGWITPTGNAGTEYLKDGGNVFKVVKETILTGSFVIGEDTKTKDRKLKVGEIVEVREWAKKEEGSGLMRMKVMLKSDGAVGYATSLGNTGIKFLENM